MPSTKQPAKDTADQNEGPAYFLVPANLSPEMIAIAKKAVCTGGDAVEFGSILWDFRQVLKAVGTPVSASQARDIADKAELGACRRYIGELHKLYIRAVTEKLRLKARVRELQRKTEQVSR